jgi:hypothetical protein
VQRSPHGSGKRTGHAHGIILLEPRNGVAHFWCEHAVDWSAIVAQPAQGRLHRSNISRIQNELVAALKIVNPSPGISGRKIGRVHVRRLMSGSPLIPLSQRIDGSKDTIIDNVKLVALRDRCAQPDDQNEGCSFHNCESQCISLLAGRSGGGKFICLPVSTLGQSGHSAWSSSGPKCV